MYNYERTYNLWHKPGFEGIAYSDGSEVESRIYEIVKKSQDRSTFSNELFLAISDWPTEYHFSRARHCLIKPLPIKPGDKVLELGSGCGVITRYLGEIGAEVTAVEGGAMRARIAGERCRDLPNVKIIFDDLLNFKTEEKFDWILLIGVLEYAPAFVKANDPALFYLNANKTNLKENGSIVVAIENKLGVKYLNGCREDHLGKSFYGIHGLYKQDQVTTYGKKELAEKLSAVGLNHINFLYPFPDYKLPSVILSDAALLQEDFIAADLLLHCQSRDYTGFTSRVFSEQLVYGELEKNHLLGDMANSFLVVAQQQQTEKFSASDIAWVYSVSERKKNLTMEILFRRNNDNKIMVKKRRLLSDQKSMTLEENGLKITHIAEDMAYFKGSLLSKDCAKALSDFSTLGDIQKSFSIWFDYLLKFARPLSGKDPKQLENWVIEGRYVDLIPRNIIKSDSQQLNVIDGEWQIEGDIPLGWVILRGIGNTLILFYINGEIAVSIEELMRMLCKEHFSFKQQSISDWIDLEQIFVNMVTERMQGKFGTRVNLHPLVLVQCQIYNKILQQLGYSSEEWQHEESAATITKKLQKEIHARDAIIESLYASTSWRITAPLRSLSSKLRKKKPLVA